MQRLFRIAIGAALVSASSGAARSAETITYSYDAKGRLVKTQRSGTVNNGVVTDYEHDKADNRRRVKTTGSPN